MALETNKTKMEPVEIIPAENYEILDEILSKDDPDQFVLRIPETLTPEMLGNKVAWEDLEFYKLLLSRPLTYEKRLPLYKKIRKAVIESIKKINPWWPKHR